MTQRCTAEEEPLAPLFNIALDFIMENNKNIYVNGWKMLSDEFKEKQGDSSVWLQETYVISRCEDMCGYLAWDQDVDGVTMIAAQFRCQLLNSKGALSGAFFSHVDSHVCTRCRFPLAR